MRSSTGTHEYPIAFAPSRRTSPRLGRRRWRAAALALAPLAGALLLGGCPQDPLGPQNRFAVIAFGQCRHDQALLLAEQAIREGNEDNVLRALLLKAAILRDRGRPDAAEALYPRIAEAWEAAKDKPLSASRRERDIQMFIDVARAERNAKGLAPDCSTSPTSAPTRADRRDVTGSE